MLATGNWKLETLLTGDGKRVTIYSHLMRVLIDGVAVTEVDASVSVFDWVVLRGFGVFEAVRSYGGALFRLDPHLDRLERSAAALAIDPPGRSDLTAWAARIAGDNGDGVVRIVLTGGGRDATFTAASRAIVMWEPLPAAPDRLSLLPTVAPWHPGTDASGFPGVKWVSYAPNMAATDRARRSGFSDALLTTVGGTVLEGPTFTIAWVADGAVETPSLRLGILRSITRDVVFECAERVGLEVCEVEASLDRLIAADEVFALSTVRQVIPVERIGDDIVPLGPVVERLAAALAEVVAEETRRLPPPSP